MSCCAAWHLSRLALAPWHDSLAEAFVCIHRFAVGFEQTSKVGLRLSPLPLLSSMRKCGESGLHYRHGPGQPLSSSLARRVRVQPLLLFLLLFVRRVRGHRLLDLIKGPWPLLWGRGEMAERGLVRLGLCLRQLCCQSVPLSYNVFFFPSASFKKLTQRVERSQRDRGLHAGTTTGTATGVGFR